MMQAPSPVDGDVRVTTVDLDGGTDGAAGGCLAEIEEAVENRAVLADVEALEMATVGGSVGLHLGRDGGEEFDVVRGVEAADVVGGSGKGAVDLHEAVEGVVDDEVVGHTDAVGLHGVALPVVVIADCRLVEVAHPPLFTVWAGRESYARNIKVCHGVWNGKKTDLPTDGCALCLPLDRLVDRE